ncbi:TIGR03915 family putative DNA repair protein [Abyssalbus ytuae]|uniref:TIGR03915 family putative DNA repair protein n=1 Tax=Abyssalbus ytuae TaxID=2926907 RepID=A0A9E6ZXH5_9FLAO|nr:TIGR03915 family putative DNA repair protein [Abyssalbus ytuae]UOB18676.1 TIGR03915 family putative DNA repair protein [Abyssalbus ytuae]
MDVILIYDGSFNGFLTAVFQVFDEKLDNVSIVSPKHYEPNMFARSVEVITDYKKAKRVWSSLQVKITKHGAGEVYKTFLSEIKGSENVLLKYIMYAYSTESFVNTDYSNKNVLRVTQVARMVSREKHRMEAFVRFQLTKDDIYFSTIEPDFNILPLISNHFKNRYADQKWVIYDLKRNYGLYYDLEKLERIVIDFPASSSSVSFSKEIFTEEELEFRELWKNYFKSTNIEERKNLKLHIKHVPRRYWKYLSEKQVV